MFFPRIVVRTRDGWLRVWPVLSARNDFVLYTHYSASSAGCHSMADEYPTLFRTSFSLLLEALHFDSVARL